MDFSNNDSQLFQSQLPSKKQEQKYRKIKVLGQGSMGKVYLVQSNQQSGKLYVMKRINIGHLQPKQKQQALSQAKLHQMVKHQNIIEFKEIYHTTKDKLCIIMQYAQNGDLDQLIKNYKDNKKIFLEEDVLRYFVQICLALKEIHDKKIVHRDLKGANIFLNKDGKIKIGDFGISKAMDKTVLASKSFAGTPYYLSPEMVEGKPYSTKADIWALGVITYHLCALKLPFDANSLPVLALKILKGSYPQIPGNNYSKQLKNLISSMLHVDQKKRISVNEILCKPIISKYLPKDFVMTITPKIKAKVQIKVEKIKLATNKSKKQLKNQFGDSRLTEQEKKKKREEEKIKREEERKKMHQDIKAKRIQVLKEQDNGEDNQLTTFLTNNIIKAQDIPSTIPSIPLLKRQIKAKKGQKPHSSKMIKHPTEQVKKPQIQNIEKPWKNKNNIKQNKQVEIEIHLPGTKRQSKMEIIEEPLPKNRDFEVEIFVQGENPYRNNQKAANHHHNKNILTKQMKQQQKSSQQIQESIQSSQYNQQNKQTNLEDLLANVQHANNLIKDLTNNPYYKKYDQIQLYEQSADFDNTINMNDFDLKRQAEKNHNKFNKLKQNQNDEENMKFITNITNTQNLEQLRQILEDRLGEDGFIKAHNIIREHFDTKFQSQQNQQQSISQEQEAYLFNRKILREKLNFLTDEQFDRNVQLLYMISILEDKEMMRNFQQEQQYDDEQDCEDEDESNEC